MEEPLNKSIIREVFSFLNRYKMTQRQLAQLIGISESEVSLLLSGKRRWTLHMLATFLNGVDMHGELYGYDFCMNQGHE